VTEETARYGYASGGGNASHDYLLPAVRRILEESSADEEHCRIFDVGCGNGVVAAHLASLGYEVVGIDAAEDGVRRARESHPDVTCHLGSAYDDLAAAYGQFPVVLSLEVVEHLQYPRRFARNVYSLVSDNGLAVISTPYHGYVKNLVLSLAGRWDRHFDPLSDHGHIKFWSRRTMSLLLAEAGFRRIGFRYAGRCALLAKSLIAVARK